LLVKRIGFDGIGGREHQSQIGDVIQQRRIGILEVEREDLLVFDQAVTAFVPIRVQGQQPRHLVDEPVEILGGEFYPCVAYRNLSRRRRRVVRVPPERRARIWILDKQG